MVVQIIMLHTVLLPILSYNYNPLLKLIAYTCYPLFNVTTSM